MILPDVNVLIGAFRSDSTHHHICRPWLLGVIEGRAPFGLSGQVLAAVVRITTNGRIFREPSALPEAIGYCDSLREQPHCRMIEPGERHWAIFREILLATDTRGARVSDAWFAALAVEHGCEWITLDRDFARFPGLRWQTPGG